MASELWAIFEVTFKPEFQQLEIQKIDSKARTCCTSHAKIAGAIVQLCFSFVGDRVYLSHLLLLLELLAFSFTCNNHWNKFSTEVHSATPKVPS